MEQENTIGLVRCRGANQETLKEDGTYMDHPKNVGDLCEMHQITPEQLAERSGLDASRTLAIALGRWTPSPVERDKIAAVFKLSKDQISWGHKTPIQHIYGHGPG